MTQPNHLPEHFSDSGFWDKLTSFAKVAGREVVEKALWLYYIAQDPNTPPKVKAMIYGALGYFIFPIDIIPDFLPLAGYTDDLGILATALISASMYLTDAIKAKAAEKIKDWFGA